MARSIEDFSGIDRLNPIRVLDRIDGWLTPREARFLVQAAQRCTGRGVIVEIGSYKGKSTVALAMGSQIGSRVRVCAIDPHAGSIAQKLWLNDGSSLSDFLTNIQAAGVAELVEPLIASSHAIAARWETPIEFLWIDGDHRYEAALKDFELFAPHVVPGGLIALHDSTDGADVSRVVQEVFWRPAFSRFRMIDSITAGRFAVGRKRLRDYAILLLHRHYRSLARIPLLRENKDLLQRALARI